MLEYLESEEVEFKLVGEFLLELKKEFGRGNEESVKMVELKRMKQEGKTIEEFTSEFKSATRENSYKRKTLVEEFKREINNVIRRNLIEIERPPTSIKQWYKCATNLDRHLRESRRENKRLRRRKNNRN